MAQIDAKQLRHMCNKRFLYATNFSRNKLYMSTDTEDSDLILFQLLSKASISAEDAVLIKKYISRVIKESIEAAVNSAISRIHFPEHDCPLPTVLTPSKISQIVTTFEALGDGDMAHGIERVRDNHRFLTGFRRAQRKISMVLASSFAVTMLAGVIAAVVFYVRKG